MFKLKRHLVPFSVIISLLATLCFVFAQESLTITTYYPSPYGSYQDLETGNLTFRYSTSTDGLVHFNNATTYDRRLRITAGFNDTTNNTQGASIDLHGNVHASYPGRLDLVAGQGGNVTFWSSPAGSNATERMRITDAGNVGIGDWTGTTGPASLFHVATSTTGAGVSTFEQASTDTDAYDLNFRKAEGDIINRVAINVNDSLGIINFRGYSGSAYVYGAAIRAYVDSTISVPGRVPAYLSFATRADTAVPFALERMRITSSGYVGIGSWSTTTLPASLFHVATSTAAAGISTFEQASAAADPASDSYDLNFRRARGTVAAPTVITTGDALGAINFNGYSGAAGYVTGAAIQAISYGAIASSKVQAYLSFLTGDNATPTVLTERLRITDSGLDVAQNTAIRIGQAYLSSGGNYVNLATNTWYNGSAWIGSGAPGILFDLDSVVNKAHIYGHNGAGVLTAWATCTSTGWAAGTSSKTFKKNIALLTRKKLAQIRQQFKNTPLYSYNRKDTPSEQEVGFILEESPELILGPDKEGINYLKAIGFLAAVLKDQELRLEQQQKKIEELERKLQ